MSPFPRAVVVSLLMVVGLVGCECGQTPTGCEGAACDGGMPVADAGQPVADAGVQVDAGPGRDDAGVPDAGGFDAGVSMPLLADYVPCTLDIDCPSGFGRCLRTLPLHHAAPNGDVTIPTSSVFSQLSPNQGVCAETCAQDSQACQTSTALAPGVTFTCQVVYRAPLPYDAGVPANPTAMAAGTAFAALCRPPLLDATLCGGCRNSSECGGGRCWDLLADVEFSGATATGTCLSACRNGTSCPGGFSCASRGGASVCVPVLRTCGVCADLDQDGQGTGFCGPLDTQGLPSVSPVDCDDADPLKVSLGAKVCGPVDHDCTGLNDDIEMVGQDAYRAQHCAACNDICPEGAIDAGLTFSCAGPAGMRTCTTACVAGRLNCDSNPDCEVAPQTPGAWFALDLDQDGFGCNAASMSCPTLTACTQPPGYQPAKVFSSTGACAAASTCPDLQDDAGTVFPGAAERCDGLDNDQDGVIDQGFSAGASVCANGTLAGVGGCAGSAVTLGAACSVTCGMVMGPGTWQCQGAAGIGCTPTVGAELACNNIDDNCNGVIDEPQGQSCARDGGVDGGLPSPCWAAARFDCNGVCQPADPTPNRSNHDVPGDSYDSDCDGTDLQGDAIYVNPSETGAATPDGGRAAPFRTLTQALDRLPSTSGRTIYLQTTAGTPAITLKTITIAPDAGVRLYGGFSAGSSWTPPSPTSAASDICMPPAAALQRFNDADGTVRGAWVGVRCRSTDATSPSVLSNVRVTVGNCGGSMYAAFDAGVVDDAWGPSAYGGVFTDCDEIILNQVTFTATALAVAPRAPFGPTGVAGAAGGAPLNLAAGSMGGRGGARFGGECMGERGSTLPPDAGNDFQGGMNGGFLCQGDWGERPSWTLERGMPGTAPTLPPFPALQPMAGVPSGFLGLDGFVRFPTPDMVRGKVGLPGAYGWGGGGGAAYCQNFGSNCVADGAPGGQGGGRGPGGSGGAPGGDAVGLVLLGSNLPLASCPSGHSTTSCGQNVLARASVAGSGGQGGPGGSGGLSGPGATPTDSRAGGGGSGGGGCAGGAGSGGRGGSSLGLVRDSFDSATVTWLSTESADGGVGGPVGPVGTEIVATGNFPVCQTPIIFTGTGVGRPGTSFPRIHLPLRSCADAVAANSDFVNGTAEWVLVSDGGIAVESRTCP